MEDRKRIQHLLALSQPVSQEVTYFKDCRPGKVNRQYTSIDRHGQTQPQVGKTDLKRPSTANAKLNNNRVVPTVFNTGRRRGGGGGNNVVRTIYMPNENVDVLKLIIQSLRTQLDEQRSFNEQRCQVRT